MIQKPAIPPIGDSELNAILSNVETWINKEFINIHKNNANKLRQYESFNINPFLLKYLSKLAYGEATPATMAKVLGLTRALGSSSSTTFGNAIRKFCINGLQGRVQKYADSHADVKFYDYIDQRNYWARLRLGPDNLNSRTAENFLDKFRDLESRDAAAAGSCAIGVLYGEIGSVNPSFKWLEDQNIRIFVGEEFWHRITGRKDFYKKLVEEIESSLDRHSESYLDDVIKELEQNLAINFTYNK